MTLREELREELSRQLEALQRRQGAVTRDRRRESGALDPDWEEQAVERENDEVLDALDSGGRAEIEQIQSALSRLDSPDFGVCSVCGAEIGHGRLRAVPTTTRCRQCAQ